MNTKPDLICIEVKDMVMPYNSMVPSHHPSPLQLEWHRVKKMLPMGAPLCYYMVVPNRTKCDFMSENKWLRLFESP